MHRAEGLLALVVWLPRSLRRRGCPGPRTPPKPYFAHTPTPGSEVTSPTPGIGGGRWPPGPRWASSRNPRPRTVPLVLTESFNELGEDPGVAFHETPLPGIARHGPDHTPPRSTSRSPKPAAQAATGRRPQQNPPRSVNPTSPRLLPDSLRAPSPAARRSTEGRSSRPGDVETPLQPLRIRSALRRAGEGAGAPEGGTSGTLGTPELGRSDGRGGARYGAGLAPTRTWSSPRPFWPRSVPGATQDFCRRRGS